MSFDDREKRHDRRFNRIYLEFRKFGSKDTCPTCHIPYVLKLLRDYGYDSKGKRIKIKWVHNHHKCFTWYLNVMMATARDSNGKLFTPEYLESAIERGYKMLKGLDKKYTEKGK